jgi:hypothetical protein
MGSNLPQLLSREQVFVHDGLRDELIPERLEIG